MVLLIFFPKYDSSSIFEALKYYLFSLSNSTFSSLPVFLFLPLPSHVFLFSVISYEFILHVADIFIFALFSSLYPFSYFLPPSSPPLLHFINVVVPLEPNFAHRFISLILFPLHSMLQQQCLAFSKK